MRCDHVDIRLDQHADLLGRCAARLDDTADRLLGFAEALVDDGAIETFLVGEVMEERGLLNADALRDEMQTGAVVATLAKESLGDFEDPGPGAALTSWVHG